MIIDTTLDHGDMEGRMTEHTAGPIEHWIIDLAQEYGDGDEFAELFLDLRRGGQRLDARTADLVTELLAVLGDTLPAYCLVSCPPAHEPQCDAARAAIARALGDACVPPHPAPRDFAVANEGEPSEGADGEVRACEDGGGYGACFDAGLGVTACNSCRAWRLVTAELAAARAAGEAL